MSGRVHKAVRKSAERCVQSHISEVCKAFFNSLCSMPLRWRLRYAYRIIFKMKEQA